VRAEQLLVVSVSFDDEVSPDRIAGVYSVLEATVRAMGGRRAKVDLWDEMSDMDGVWTDDDVADAVARSKAEAGASS